MKSNKVFRGLKLQRILNIIERDRLFHLFGMRLDDSSEGFAKVSAEVKEEFLNAHQIAHGAMIFALLDVAFAIAVNSIVDSVGVQWSFNIFRSTKLGDTISAQARVIHKGRNLLVVEFEAISESTKKQLAQGMATAMPLPMTRKGDTTTENSLPNG